MYTKYNLILGNLYHLVVGGSGTKTQVYENIIFTGVKWSKHDDTTWLYFDRETWNGDIGYNIDNIIAVIRVNI